MIFSFLAIPSKKAKAEMRRRKMNIFRIIAVGVVGALLSTAVKSYRPEYGILTGTATGIIIMLMMCESLFDSVAAIREIIDKTGIDAAYFKITLKVIGISYISQFGTELCRDAGENAIAAKIDAAGKVCIMALTIPIISGFLELIIKMLSAL